MQQVVASPPAEGRVPERNLGLDRFTIGFGVGLLVIVGVVFVLVLGQGPTAPVDDSAPAGVVHNYYLAIQQGDLAQAYRYLSPDTTSWLSYEQFAARASQRPGNTSVRVGDVRVDDDTAVVNVEVTRYYSGGPFSSGQYMTTDTIVLRHEPEGWRIALPRPTIPGAPIDVNAI